MPHGSSSAAPVIHPGPRFEKNPPKRSYMANARLRSLGALRLPMTPDSTAYRDRLNPCAWGFKAGIAVLLRRETSLLPAILPDSTCLAKVYKRVRRCPALGLRERLRWRHARSWSSDAPLVLAGKPYWSAQGLVWSFHVRSDDLLFRGARRRRGGRGRQGH